MIGWILIPLFACALIWNVWLLDSEKATIKRVAWYAFKKGALAAIIIATLIYCPWWTIPALTAAWLFVEACGSVRS